jgi:hypothetical protein
VSKQFDNRNRGALFRDDSKASTDDRDYSGSLNVEGTDYWVSAWIKTSKAGKKYMSLSVKPKVEKPDTTRSLRDDLEDEVPW